MSSRNKLILATFVWLSLCIAGLAGLLIWEHEPGQKTVTTVDVARQFGPVAEDEYLLVMSVHPQCPCSRASMSELALLITHSQNVRAKVLFYCPKNFSTQWAKSDLWTTANAIPRVETLIDADGKMSDAIGAVTSGHSVLCDDQGKIVFSGGITGSRGHEGDNAGRSNVEAIASGKRTDVIAKTNVFGCPLKEPLNHECRTPE